MRANLQSQKRAILSELRTLAQEKAKNGVFDTSDVKDLIGRARADGVVTTDEAKDLSFIRTQYADIMDKDAAGTLDTFLSSWIADQMLAEQRKAAKEKEREKKATAQVERIDTHLEMLDEWRKEVDQRLKDMQIDTKTRVMITNFFNLKHDG